MHFLIIQAQPLVHNVISLCQFHFQVLSNPIKKLMEFNNKALGFKCVWDDRHDENDELRKYELFYYLQDDCVEVKEIHGVKSGRDPFTLLLRKTRLPKNWKDLPSNRFNSFDSY